MLWREEVTLSDNEFDVIETILSGEPIPLLFAGVNRYGNCDSRDPLEVDKIKAVQTLAYDSAG